MNMSISEIFAELGRMHLEIMQLREQLAQSQEQLTELQKSEKPETK